MTVKRSTKRLMTHLICKGLAVLLLVMFSWSPAYGQSESVNVQLFKKGQTFTFTEDLHCMDNATALVVSKKLRLCPAKCDLKLEELQKLYDVDLKTLTEKIELQKNKYTEIISEKDKTISKIQLTAIDEISKVENSIWWKVTLGVVGGALLGAGITVLAIEISKGSLL